MLHCVIVSGLLLLCGGCDGRARLKESGDVELSRFRSATWFQSDPVPFSAFADGELSDLGEGYLDPLSMVSYRRGCFESKRDFDKWSELSAHVLEAETEQARCEAMIGLASWQDSQADDLPDERAVLYGGADALSQGERPTSGETYTDGAYGYLITRDTSECPPRVSWDGDTCTSIPVDCGTTHTYEIEDAVLTVGLAATSVNAELTGNLTEDGDDLGPLDVSFKADVCDLGAVGPLVFY